jgi:hypothetical protein
MPIGEARIEAAYGELGWVVTGLTLYFLPPYKTTLTRANEI